MMCNENFNGTCFWKKVSVQLRLHESSFSMTEKLLICTQIVTYNIYFLKCGFISV